MESKIIYVESSNVLIDILIPLIALLIAILTFAIERYISKKIDRKNNRINWFLTIIVEPQLKEINDVYLDLIEKLKNEVSELEDLQKKGNKSDLYNALKEKNLIIKKSYQKNFIPLISMVESYDFQLSIEVKNILLEANDIYSLELAKATMPKSDVIKGQTIEVLFYSNRSKLYKILYTDLHKS